MKYEIIYGEKIISLSDKTCRPILSFHRADDLRTCIPYVELFYSDASIVSRYSRVSNLLPEPVDIGPHEFRNHRTAE